MLRNCMELSDTLQFQSCVYFYVMWLCVLVFLLVFAASYMSPTSIVMSSCLLLALLVYRGCMV